jgi:hypothetical protein
MLLANVVLMAQIAGAGNSTAREVTRPCADPSALCRISPFFCPGTYPQGLEPCWPEGTRQPRNIGGRGGTTPQSAPAAAPSRTAPQRTRSSGPSKLTRASGD